MAETVLQPGDRIIMVGGKYNGRAGQISRNCSEAFKDHIYVIFDRQGAERKNKVVLVELQYVHPEPGEALTPFDNTGPERFCRKCGCTEDNACITDGIPCHWVADDLCSACVTHTDDLKPQPKVIPTELSIPKSTSNMKSFVIQTAAFYAVLKKVKEVISKNPAHPQLDNILIKVRRKDVQIIATDLMVTLIAEVDITNDKDYGYEFLLPFKFLLDTVNLINDTNIIVDLIEKEKKEGGKKVYNLNVVLTTFSDVYNLDFLDSTHDWPKLPEFPKENSVGIADGFIEWLNFMCDTAVPEKDVARPAMQKIFISIANNGITMATTNAHVLVEKTFQCESVNTTDLLVHPKIAKALKGFKETSISWSDTHMAFVSSNMTLIGTLQDEKYPNYRAVFPAAVAANLKLTLAELTGIMDKCALTGKPADIWLKREIGHVVFESQDLDYNRKITIRAGADYSGNCDRVAVTPEEFLKLLGQIKYVSLDLAIIDSTKPILITTESDPTYRSLIMPCFIPNA